MDRCCDSNYIRCLTATPPPFFPNKKRKFMHSYFSIAHSLMALTKKILKQYLIPYDGIHLTVIMIFLSIYKDETFVSTFRVYLQIAPYLGEPEVQQVQYSKTQHPTKTFNFLKSRHKNLSFWFCEIYHN